MGALPLVFMGALPFAFVFIVFHPCLALQMADTAELVLAAHNGRHGFVSPTALQGEPAPQPQPFQWADVVQVAWATAAFVVVGLLLLQLRPAPSEPPAAARLPSAPVAGPRSLPDRELCVGRAAQRPALAVPDLMFRVAEQSPERRALVAVVNAERVEVSYGAFAQSVRRMARQFVELGVRPGDRVLLRIRRNLNQMVAVYGCMVAGGVVVPVDPDVPEAWLRSVVEDTGAVLLVEEVGRTPPPGLVRAVEAPEDGSPLRALGGGPPVHEAAGVLPELKPQDWCIIFYTSGSTGRPKGVLHSHTQLQNAAYGIAEDANVGPASVVLLRSPAVWSTYEWEAFPALMVGATLVLASPEGHKDPVYLARVLEEEAVHMMAITPKSLDLVLDAVEQAGLRLPQLRDVASTGEQLPTVLANRFLRLLPHARLHNGYNPTESAACTWYSVPAGGLDLQRYPTNVPAGLPQPGVSVYVMDPDHPKELRELPEGEEGEIMFGGLLSGGYWNREALTAEKFVDSPWGPLYHSGDKGKWEGGLLITLGRIDRQLKVKGVRVEPEEVEAIMSGCWSELRKRRFGDAPAPGAGVACTASKGDSPELVAFVAPTATAEEVAAIEAAVRRQLPACYAPSRFQTLERLPSTATGKVDLKALEQMATDLVAEGIIIEDSLGSMKRVLARAAQEQEVLHHMSVFWLVCVIVSHWYGCNWVVDQPRTCVYAPASLPGWGTAILAGMSTEVCVFGLMLVKAYQDSGASSGRLRLGEGDLVMVFAYVIIGLASACWNHDFPYYTLNYRWWLMTVLASRLVIRGFGALEDHVGLRVPPSSQMLLMLIWALLNPPLALDLCQTAWAPQWLRWAGAVAVAGQIGAPNTCSPFGLPNMGIWYGMLYAAGFHFGRDGVQALRGRVGDRLSGPGTALFALGAYLCFTTATAYDWPLKTEVYSVARDNLWLHQVPVRWALMAAQVALLVLGAAGLPFSSRRLGQSALGIYVFHRFWPAEPFGHFVQGLHLPGPLVLAALLGAVLLWMATAGTLGHAVLLAPVRLLARPAKV